MKLSQQSHSLIESTVKKAIGKYPCGCEQTAFTDIYLQPNPNSAELTVFNDDDEILAGCIINEWFSYSGNNFYKDVERILRNILVRLKESRAFDTLPIIRPYSFVLVDEEKETISELLLMDDDLLLVNDELLKGLDEELDAFLKDLLEN